MWPTVFKPLVDGTSAVELKRAIDKAGELAEVGSPDLRHQARRLISFTGFSSPAGTCAKDHRRRQRDTDSHLVSNAQASRVNGYAL
jgi:hypothetical protein